VPEIGSGSGRADRPAKAKPAAKPKAKARPTYKVTVPDAGESSRTTKLHPVTPDQADRQRGVQTRAHDRAVTARVVRGQREKAVAKAGRGAGTRAVKAFVTQNVHEQAAEKTKDVHGRHGGSKLAVIAANIPVAGFSGRVLVNAAKDAGELAVTTPSSVAHLVSTAAHHPGKLPGELAKPYVDFAKHPLKSAEEKPISTALMLQPAGRVPGRVLGKVARVTGKQTLERPAATLPGTALKETRTGSRDVAVRHVQAKKDAANPAPKATVRQVQRRVDEAFGTQQKHRERIEEAIMRKAEADAKALPKAARPAHMADQKAIARAASGDQAHREYVREFGAVHQVTKKGHIVIPKAATEGTLHATRDAAQKVADRLNRTPVTLKMGGFTKAEEAFPLARQHRPVNFVVHKAGETYGVIPDFVAERLSKHAGVGTSRAPGAKLLRMSRGSFTRAVLPYRPTWLSGQAVEGVLRSAVHGAGPTSYVRARKLISTMERDNPGSGKALLDRAVPGGKVGRVYKEFADLGSQRRTFAEEFPDNPIAHAITSLGRTPGVKQVRDLHHSVSSAVFTHLNARFLEGIPQTAMLGKALKNSPLMEHSIIGLSDKAIQDAANGLQATHAQVELARAVQRAYGKYSNFGPGLREAIIHWTPFIPWLLNSGRFLVSVLPKDHPLHAALIADLDTADEEWRKSHDLSLRQPNHVPFYMLGGVPRKNGSVLQLGHYTPFGAAQDPTGGLAGLVLPQFAGAYGALQYGVDWKGKDLKHPDGTSYTAAEKFLYGLAQLGEAMVPLTAQAAAVAGADDKTAALRKQFRLMASTPGRQNTSGGASPSSSSSPGRIKVPGASGGRIKVPGVTGGRIKIPGG
jgi:hypothetical protein